MSITKKLVGAVGALALLSFTSVVAITDGELDGDGLVDYPDDPGCRDQFGIIEDPECQDGVDNDGDLLTDYPDDPDCMYAWGDDENWIFSPVCGLGVELVLALTPVMWLYRRRSRRL